MGVNPKRGDRFRFGPGASSDTEQVWVVSCVRGGEIFAVYAEMWDLGSKRANHGWPIDWFWKCGDPQWV